MDHDLLGSHERIQLSRPGARLPIRVQAALTALAFVVSSLIGLVHEATTRHVRCAEHGELMHGDPTVAAQPASPAPARDRAVRDGLVTTMHGHEHCSLTSTTRASRVELRGPAVMPSAQAICDVGGGAPRVAARPGDSLYRTAPKTSPPA